MFIDAMDGGVGAAELTCDFCGRTHLCPNSDRGDDDEESWQQYCRTEHEDNPTKVVLHPHEDAVSGRYIDEKLFVLDCVCGYVVKYEKWIWNNRNIIRNYLKARVDQEKIWADQEATLNMIAGVY